MPGSETGLKSDDEVALLPPVSGGSEGEGETPFGRLRAGLATDGATPALRFGFRVGIRFDRSRFD